MKNNNKSGSIIKWLIIAFDFVIFNAILYVLFTWVIRDAVWQNRDVEVFVLINNIALLISQLIYSPVVYFRIINAGEIIKRVVNLTILQAVLSYVLLRVFSFPLSIGWYQFGIGTVFFILSILNRLAERELVKLYRRSGRNFRTVTFVGSDSELVAVYERMKNDSSLGYKVLGYYADAEMGTITHSIEDCSEQSRQVRDSIMDSEVRHSADPSLTFKKLGSMQEFLDGLNHPSSLVLGDELYLSVSRRDKTIIRNVSLMCDRNVIRFYYVPVSVESIGLNLKRELFDDVEVFAAYENPLNNPLNRIMKRTFDVVFSLIFLIPTALLFPFIFVIMKIQSPGPILFKQKRTGLDGKDFEILKFRTMHVNSEADSVQATKNDPRKYPFGNFMRKSNIDELPQFINVLKGDMSIVGPRPHMLVHTEMYSELIDQYMVRHFVKPGVTGWAQVTGFRGETKELWQMEGRVKRDIWYIENWSFWLDIRIIWLTVKSIFVHDENAY